MTRAGRVAVVSPREERRNSARGWAPLLHGRAEVRLCASPDEARGAEVIALDAETEGAPDWEARFAGADPPANVVVFAGGDGSEAVRWGENGEEVLAIISDLLDRRALLGESDALLASLRASGDQLEAHRRRLAALATAPEGDAKDDRAALARDVERLTRLAAVARFLAAPGPEEDFAPALSGVVAKALAASAVAMARHDGTTWRIEGRQRFALKAAREILPDPAQAERPRFAHRCTHRQGDGFWIPVGTSPPVGLVGITPAGQGPEASLGAEGVSELQALLADAFDARAAARAMRQRQTQSERAVQTLRSGLLKVDADERVLLVNPALAAMLETGASALEGRPLAEAFARDPHVVDMLRAFLARPEGLDELETFVTSTGGRRVAVSLRASALGDGAGRMEGILVLVSDLARRKELEAEVRKAERLAALGRLSAGVAHEIRNPLAGIRTTAELLRGRLQRADTELVRFADVILEETERLDRIVGSLLQFARPAPPRRQDIRPDELLERALRLAAGRASERGVRLRHRPGPDLPELSGDRDQLLQVLLNLLLNAVDATPQGGEVTLAADADADEVRLVVEDGGEGVPATLRERVFDPFFTTKPGGTGLGLSISQNILRQHGGRLRLERPDGGRSRAIATVPRGGATPQVHPGGAAWRTS